MTQLTRFKFGNLNKYSCSLIVAFICVTFAMQNYSGGISLEGFFISIPLISIVVFWSEQRAYLIGISDCNLKKINVFYRDLFTITFTLILANLLSLLFQYNNSDARGWWVLFVYYTSFCGFIFAFIFSLIALILPHHRTYMIIFSYLIFTIFLLSKFWPYYISVLFIGKINTFFMIMCSLISMHFLFFITGKLVKLLSKDSFE